MKLFYIYCDSYFSFDTKIKSIYFSDLKGSKFNFSGKNISLEQYIEDIYYTTYFYKGEEVDIFLKYGASYGDSNLAENKNILFLSKKNKLSLDIPTQYALLYGTKEKSSEILVSDYENTTIRYDFDNHTYQLFSYQGFSPCYYGGEYYHIPQAPFIMKVDDGFNIKWQVDKNNSEEDITYPRFVDGNAKKPIALYNNTLIVNLSAKYTEQESLTEKLYKSDGSFHGMGKEAFFIDGTLYCLYKEDGTVKWTQTFPVQIDDFTQLNEEQVVVASERYLYIVSCETGDIVNTIDTEIRQGERQECISISLLIHGDYLFVFGFKDCCLQIWDKNTLTKLRTIDAREQGWQFACLRPKVIDHQIFVPITLKGDELSGGAIFVIDANDIHAKVEVEEGPEFIQSLPSKDKPSGIHFSVDHPDWGHVLRFAERELLKAVLLYSSPDYQKYFTPRTVHLSHSGYSAEKALVQEKMDIFKNRFERYVQEPHIPGFGIAPIEFSYTLL
jgi:hypothetical protein